MNQSTSTSTESSVTIPTVSGQRTTKEPIQKRNTTPQVAGNPQTNINPRIDPQMHVDPRVVHHRGTRGLSSTVSLESFNSPNNINNNTITYSKDDDTRQIPSTTGGFITCRSRYTCYTCNYAYSAIPRDKENS
jgi:hypothetical protein